MQITLILLLTLPSHNKLQNNLRWQGLQDSNLPLKQSFSVEWGHPTLIQSQQSGLQSWNLHNILLRSMFLPPMQNFSCCNTCLLPLVLPVQPWDKPLFILLLDFGRSVLCLQQLRRDWHAGGFTVPWVSPQQPRAHNFFKLKATFKANTCFLFPFNFRRLEACTADCSLLTQLSSPAELCWHGDGAGKSSTVPESRSPGRQQGDHRALEVPAQACVSNYRIIESPRVEDTFHIIRSNHPPSAATVPLSH